MTGDPIDSTLPDVSKPVDESDRVYNALRAAIARGDVQPGQRLASERTLAIDLGMPRTAVRRALQRLASEGAIERGIGRAGSRVRTAELPQSNVDALQAGPQDVLEARWVFEPGLVPLIVARATEDDFRNMETQLRCMRDARTQQEFREAGYTFHLELVRSTRNPLLIGIFELIIEARANAGWGHLSALNATKEQQSIQTRRNAEVLRALRERDTEAATALLGRHLRSMLDDVTRGGHAASDAETLAS